MRSENQNHTKAVCNIFQIVGSYSQSEETRVRNNHMEDITTVPQATLQQKDHKPLQPDGNPKTRFLCHASTTYNQRLSNLLNDCLKATIESDKTDELISTKDFLHNVESLNNRIKTGEIKPDELIIGSLDVENLHGSMDTNIAADIIRNRVVNSNVKFESIY